MSSEASGLPVAWAASPSAPRLPGVTDPNLPLGLSLGRGLAPHAPPLPASLADVGKRAEFVNKIDRPWLVDGYGVIAWAEMGRHLESAAAVSAAAMADVTDPLDRMSVALRVWAGCLYAAKTIANETRSGANTADARARIFTAVIDPIAADDPVFRAGVEAAPAFHAIRRKPCFLDGVPADSAVWLYADRFSGRRAEADQ